MQTLEKIGGFLLVTIITITLGLCLMILQVHIIYEIAHIYNLFLITLMPLEVMYGILFVLGFIRTRLPKEKNDEDDDTLGQAFVKTFLKQFKMLILYLMGWLVAGVVHFIIFQ